MAAKDELGRAGEDHAVAYLLKRGYTILERNWRCPQGEIDIVALTEGRLSVVEVKTRRSDGFGHPLEAIDARKRRRLWRLALAWRADHPQVGSGCELRVEAIGITGSDMRHAVLEHLVDIA